MRFPRTAALLGVALLYLTLGPWVLLAALGGLLVPAVRDWLRPTWRVTVAWVAAALALAGLVVLVPDGWLPVPPGPGAWVTPRYLGRPAAEHPIRTSVPQHPGLAPNGTSSPYGDGWASDSTPWSGPLGESPRVDTAWYGLGQCAGPATDSRGRLVSLCGDVHGSRLRVIGAGSMRPMATKELPDGAGGSSLWGSGCGAPFFLDDADRAVVATADRHVLVVATADAEGHPDLTTRASYDLSEQVPADDCVTALVPDWHGRLWWVTRHGLVGTVGPSGEAKSLDLGEDVVNSAAVDRDGVYVVTTHAMYRLGARDGGRPAVTWRAEYDRGSGRKPGQLSQGSGTTPTVLPGGLVAITDNADPRMHVQFYDTRSGDLVCQQAVFGDDEGATQGSLVSVGTGVVVANDHGYRAPLSTVLGRTTDAGVARVNVRVAPGPGRHGRCSLAWTADLAAPSSVPTVSLANGLLYAVTKRHSWWGADAWYLTAVDVRNGRAVFSVRTGLGALLDTHRSAVTIARDGSAYVSTLGGMVRVHDRE